MYVKSPEINYHISVIVMRVYRGGLYQTSETNEGEIVSKKKKTEGDNGEK